MAACFMPSFTAAPDDCYNRIQFLLQTTVIYCQKPYYNIDYLLFIDSSFSLKKWPFPVKLWKIAVVAQKKKAAEAAFYIDQNS
ncbi:MAG: hypothetical protein U0T84_03235 [Chitinophagales bacterium]